MSRFFCLCDGVKLEKNCEHFSSLNEVDSLTHGISSARSRVGIVNRSTFFLLSWPPFSVFFYRNAIIFPVPAGPGGDGVFDDDDDERARVVVRVDVVRRERAAPRVWWW